MSRDLVKRYPSCRDDNFVAPEAPEPDFELPEDLALDGDGAEQEEGGEEAAETAEGEAEAGAHEADMDTDDPIGKRGAEGPEDDAARTDDADGCVWKLLNTMHRKLVCTYAMRCQAPVVDQSHETHVSIAYVSNVQCVACLLMRIGCDMQGC